MKIKQINRSVEGWRAGKEGKATSGLFGAWILQSPDICEIPTAKGQEGSPGQRTGKYKQERRI